MKRLWARLGISLLVEEDEEAIILEAITERRVKPSQRS